MQDKSKSSVVTKEQGVVRESFNRGEQQHGLVPKEEGGKVSILNDIRERYNGEQIMNRYSGQGKYKYEHGTYEGEFLAGKFHGEGKLYVRGGHWTGIWEEGNLKYGKKFVFDDELDHKGSNEVEWSYCTATDPRFYREITEGVCLNQFDPTNLFYPHLCPYYGTVIPFITKTITLTVPST